MDMQFQWSDEDLYEVVYELFDGIARVKSFKGRFTLVHIVMRDVLFYTWWIKKKQKQVAFDRLLEAVGTADESTLHQAINELQKLDFPITEESIEGTRKPSILVEATPQLHKVIGDVVDAHPYYRLSEALPYTDLTGRDLLDLLNGQSIPHGKPAIDVIIDALKTMWNDCNEMCKLGIDLNSSLKITPYPGSPHVRLVEMKGDTIDGGQVEWQFVIGVKPSHQSLTFADLAPELYQMSTLASRAGIGTRMVIVVPSVADNTQTEIINNPNLFAIWDLATLGLFHALHLFIHENDRGSGKNAILHFDWILNGNSRDSFCLTEGQAMHFLNGGK